VDASKPAAKPRPAVDAGWRTTPYTAPDGSLDGWVPGQGMDLQARIQVTGDKLPCGACGVLIAQAQGGMLPYQYTWSDPSLQGPGPHQVCPTIPTSYSVTVTDSTPTGAGEFKTEQQSVIAEAQLDCTVGQPGDWAGCEPPGADNDVVIDCEGLRDGGVLTETGFNHVYATSSAIKTPLLVGKTYEFNYDNILPFYIGDGIDVDVYGAMSDKPCEKLTKLFTLRHDAYWHQSYCFTADRPYDRAISHVSVRNIWFDFQLGTIGTLCKGCSKDP
jgi:hypothetical protein